jgi:tetratricopeptide (TPR) repeat protein
MLLCSVVLLTACGHVQETRSARLVQAAEFNQRAQNAFLHGKYQYAATLYGQALQLDVAIEYVDGIAINTLNLARVNQVLGKTAQAEQLLDQLLNDKALRYAPKYLAEAAVQKALLHLQKGDAVDAVVWADKAVDWCGPDCKLSGVIANVRAGIALRMNDGEQALFWSDRALAANRDIPLEHANALRLQASARLMMNAPDEALRLAQDALTIDKLLGLPAKIRQDLLLLAQVHERLGHTEQAGQFRQRAARIAAVGMK